jgi:hypothetical protein
VPPVNRRSLFSIACGVLIVIGLLFVAIGVVYLTKTASHLPSYFPGHVRHRKHQHHYTKRGAAALVVAVLAFVGAFFAWTTAKSSSSASSAEPMV